MRRMRLSLFAMLVLAAMSLLLAGCGRKGLINVNGEKIAKDEFYARLERVPVQTVKNGRAVTVPAGQYVIEQIINERLVQQLAKKENCAATQEQVDKQLAYLKKSSGGNFLAQLRQQGVTKQDWEKQAMLQLSVINLLGKGVTISDAEAKKNYDLAIAHTPSPFKRAEAVNISVIICKSQDKIDKAYKLLQDNQEFGTVAMKLSEDPTTAPGQGIVGWMSKDMQMVPAQIRQTAFATPVGKYSAPFHVADKKDSGWVIVKVDGKRKAVTDSFDDVKDLIKQQLAVTKGNRTAFDKSMRDFLVESKIQVNAERYKQIPELLKKNASLPANLQPGKMPGAAK